MKRDIQIVYESYRRNVKPLGQGNMFDVYESLDDSNYVVKVCKCSSISHEALNKIKFMRDNYDAGIFAHIPEITTNKYVQEKVCTNIDLSTISLLFTDAIATSQEEKDALSYEWYAEYFLNTTRYAECSIWFAHQSKIFLERNDALSSQNLMLLSNLLQSLSKIKNWNTINFADIHHKNIGIKNNKLIIFDL